MPGPLVFRLTFSHRPQQQMLPSQMTDLVGISLYAAHVQERTPGTFPHLYNSSKNDNHLFFFEAGLHPWEALVMYGESGSVSTGAHDPQAGLSPGTAAGIVSRQRPLLAQT